MSEKGDKALQAILSGGNGHGKPPTAPDPEPRTTPTLTELEKSMEGTKYQMGFVFVDGKAHSVIIDADTPVLTNHPQTITQEPRPAGKVAHDYIKPAIYEAVKKAVKAGLNPVIYGPAGSGKSRLCKELAADLGLDFHAMSFSGGLRYSQVFGGQELKDGSTQWTPAPLLTWFQKPCLICLDEIFSADPEITIGLNSILEPNTRRIQTPAGLFEVHPESRFIACSNANGRQQSRQYTGTTRSDDSLLDRLIPPFFMDYDTEAEKAIIKNLVDDSTADSLTRKLSTFRKQIKDTGTPFDPSTRRLIAACQLVKAGFNTTEAFRLAFMASLSQAELAGIRL